jgi:hypothetical protein
MRPLAIAGVILIIAGGIVLAMRGFSYTKKRDSVQVGPIGMSVDEKGFVPPIVGAVALAAGVVLVIASRRSA